MDLLSASIFGFGFGFVFVFFVFVRERVRKSEEVPRMKHSLYPTHRRKIERVKGSMDVETVRYVEGEMYLKQLFSTLAAALVRFCGLLCRKLLLVPPDWGFEEGP